MDKVTKDYVICFADSVERQFQAVDDEQALGLAQKRYQDQLDWRLYRISQGKRLLICDSPPNCPREQIEKEEQSRVPHHG